MRLLLLLAPLLLLSACGEADETASATGSGEDRLLNTQPAA